MTHLSALLLALLALPAAQPDDLPVLLDFHADWCGPCRQMRPAVERLSREGYPVRSIDMDRSPELASRYNVDQVPTFIVVDPQGRELDRISGARPVKELAVLYNNAYDAWTQRSGTTQAAIRPASDPAPEDIFDAEDAEAPSRLPRPWETVVRIKIFNRGSVGFGSGTIIHSTDEESIILTCAHIFKIEGARRQYPPSKFPLKIQVDLFDGRLHGMRPAQVHPVESLRGEAIDYDFAADVGLIRIRPGRRLPASPVVPPSWRPQVGMNMITVGCSEGNDATAWSTKITNPQFRGLVGNANYTAIECNHAPKQGRSGGGLYTPDGYLAGVCDFAAPADRRGLYAHPTAIYRLLDRNNLTLCYNPSAVPDDVLVAGRRPDPARRPTPSPATAPATTLRAQNSSLPDTQPIPSMPGPERLGIEVTPIAAAGEPAANTRTTAGPGGGWQAPAGVRRAAGGDGAALVARTESDRSPSTRPASLPGAGEVAGLVPETGDEARTVGLQMDPAVTAEPLPDVTAKSDEALPDVAVNAEDVPPLLRPGPEAPAGGWRAVRRSPPVAGSH